MHEDILYYFISEMFIYSILYYLEDTRDKFSNILYFILPSFLHFNAFKKKKNRVLVHFNSTAFYLSNRNTEQGICY